MIITTLQSGSSDLVCHATYVVCVNFIREWRNLQFKVANFIYSELLPDICWEKIAFTILRRLQSFIILFISFYSITIHFNFVLFILLHFILFKFSHTHSFSVEKFSTLVLFHFKNNTVYPRGAFSTILLLHIFSWYSIQS